ncbi:Ankyrin repeat-containing domain protein [Rhypophila decipiens]
MDKTSAPETALEPPTYEIDSAIKALSPAGFGKITSPSTQAVQQLEGTADPNLSLSSPDFDPLKALFYGIRNGLPTIVSLLLSPPYSLDPNSVLVASSCQDQDDAQTKHEDSGNDEKFKGKTALHIAILQEEPVIVGILLKAGADPITIREQSLNHTPFDLALCKGHKDIVQLMLDEILKPTTEAGKKRDLTASHVAQHSIRHAVLYAASSRNVEVVKVLLERRFPVDTRTDIRDRSALLVAAELGAVDIVRVLAEADVYILTNDDETPLSVAMMRNQRGVVRELVRLGVDLDVPWTENTRTALSLAAEQDIDGMVDLLLDLGADPDIPDAQGRTALYYAISSGREGNVKQLVYRGAYAGIDAKTAHQCNLEHVLFVAVTHGHVTTAALVLCMEMDVNCKNSSGQTPLTVAARKGDGPMLELMLGFGEASLELLNNQGQTALFEAASFGNDEAIGVLLGHGADLTTKDQLGRTPLMAAAHYRHDKAAKALIESGVSLDWADYEGRTALNYAAASGSLSLVTLFLLKGAQVDNPDEDGHTPLLSASRCGKAQVVQILLQAGACFSRTDRNGKTALLLAAECGHESTVNSLLDSGSDMDHQCSNGQTPLMLACSAPNESNRIESDLGFDSIR